MPRRIYTYDDYTQYAVGGNLSALNMTATVGAFMFGLGVILMLVNFLVSLKTGEAAGPDPWGGNELEWTISSPPPPENFTVTPALAEHPYTLERRNADAATGSLVTGVIKK